MDDRPESDRPLPNDATGRAAVKGLDSPSNIRAFAAPAAGCGGVCIICHAVNDAAIANALGVRVKDVRVKLTRSSPSWKACRPRLAIQ